MLDVPTCVYFAEAFDGASVALACATITDFVDWQPFPSLFVSFA